MEMVAKKPDRKTVGRCRLSLVSPSLNGALCGTTQLALPQDRSHAL